MKKFFIWALFLMIWLAAPVFSNGAEGQTIIRAGDNASVKGPANWFTGSPRIDPLWPDDKNVNASGAYVNFAPGERSAWHEHPAGQTLVVLYGVGRVGTADGKVYEIRPGDVVRCPPKIRHWHGASPQMGMTHLAVTGVKDGKNAIWYKKVTDEEYSRPVSRLD